MTSVREAEADLASVRAEYGRGSMRTADAFQRLCRAYAENGRRIDDLRSSSPDEEERFFAQTASGTDGHVYWLGPFHFVRNDGKHRRPIRWWWETKLGELEQYDVVKPACGQMRCINPEHAVLENRADRRRLFTDEAVIGALQVEAMRRGRPPGQREWKAAGLSPSAETIQGRFGSWDKALAAAGLRREDWRGGHRRSPADCIESLRAARRFLGYWPRHGEWNGRLREHLRSLGLPTSRTTIVKLLGPWSEALRRAGKR